MASWSELLHSQDPNDPDWLDKKLKQQLSSISKRRGDTTVIFYASAFLQKAGGSGSITREDVNGFMNALYETPTDKGLTLILHTPGGDPNAVESIVEYLHSKFDYLEVIVPYLAMSGGAMISLASNLLILGRQSQLGPIDPQLIYGSPHIASGTFALTRQALQPYIRPLDRRGSPPAGPDGLRAVVSLSQNRPSR